jgi:leucyl aminopeptidase
MKKFPIDIITTLTSNTETRNLILEIRSSERIATLTEYGLSPLQIDKITTNLTLDTEKQKKTIIFSHISDMYDTITCFFPSVSLMDDRSSLFSSLKQSSVFSPEGDETDAIEALTLATYSYDVYLSKPSTLRHTILISEDNMEHVESKIQLLNAILWARDMINMPAKDANPIGIVTAIQSYPWKQFNVEVFDKAQLEKLGCNLLLAVSAGSDVPPYMVVIRPKAPVSWEKYGLIGKGVTFDAGGLQIKPDTGMLDMKCDMSGAAGMVGVAMYLDTLDALPVDLTVAIWLTENMTGGSAFRPLDIYKAHNGTTVEIHHTDAEGRLVLADVMSYVEDVYHVDHLITMATLTGACIHALGHDIAGIMGDDEDTIRQLLANTSPYESVWRLPLNDKMKKALKADIADLKNIARSEKAGSSEGGAFLTYFQGKAKLTHLDIAGPAYRETTYGYMPKWGTGWGVKVLSEFLIAQSSK